MTTHTNAEVRAYLTRIAADAFEQTIGESYLGSTLTVRQIAELRREFLDRVELHPAYATFVADEDEPELPGGWLSTNDAAALVGITPASFRREVTRAPELQRARAIVAASTVYRRDAVKAWHTARPGKGNRTSRNRNAALSAVARAAGSA